MPSSPLSPRHLIAQQFDRRPTLRQILAEDVLAVLIGHYPDISTEYPELHDANAFSLVYPPDAEGLTRVEPLMDALLRTFLAGERTAFGEGHHLSLDPPRRFRAFRHAPADTPIDQVNVRLEALNGQVDTLLDGLLDDFHQAQFDYWQATGPAGTPRAHWVRQVLRQALATGLRDQSLDERQVGVLRGLLLGGARRPAVHSLQVQLQWQGRTSRHVLPDLLVSSERDLPGQVLWCSPAGLVRTFDSLDSFAKGLRALLAERYAFDSLRWSRQKLEGDAFAQQAALMLDALLAGIQQLRHARSASVTELEAAFAAASDPAGWFSDSDQSRETGQALAEPEWLQAASEDQRCAYQAALLELALAQGEAGTRSSQDGVLDLHRYASERLRAQLLDDYPDEANYYPDDLQLHLTIAQGVGGGGGAGPGGGEPLVAAGVISLTDLAINSLSALGPATVSRITHRNDQLIMSWMNPAYLYALVDKVDIGGRYPAYVAEKLSDPVGQGQRVDCFAREWRCRLRLDALEAWVAGQIGETAWRVVADFCDSDRQHPPRRAAIAQLAFKREATATALDRVHGMYVIRPRDPGLPGLLYRPLYADRPLIEITSRNQLLGLLQQRGELQDSVLDWLVAGTRGVYDHGGFSEPHLNVVTVDTSTLPSRPRPPDVVVDYLTDIDQGMYDIATAQLIELASRQAVSTAQSRWASLKQGAWLLFDTVSLLVRGPVAVLLWVVQGVSALANDLAALRGSSGFERSSAVVDLLLNLGMVLLHARLPDGARPVNERPPRPLLGTDAMPRVRGMPFEEATLDEAAGQGGGFTLDHAFVGGENLNGLSSSQRAALKRLRSDVSLVGVKPEATGGSAGLYAVKGGYYLRLGSGVYRVRRGEGAYDLVGPQGEQGPFIRRVGGRWQLEGGRLAGGAPVDVSAQSRARLVAALQEDLVLSLKARPAKRVYALDLAAVEKLEASIRVLETAVADAPHDTALAQQLQGALRDVRNARVEALEAVEPMVEHARVRDNALNVPVLMRYADEEGVALARQMDRARGEARFEWLAYEEVSLRYALLSVDYDALAQLEARVKGRFVTDVAALYQQYRQRLESTVNLNERALRASKGLDRLLAQTTDDPSVMFQDKAPLLSRLKRQRHLTTVFIQAFQLEGIAALTMRMDRAVSNEQLLLIDRMLRGPKLRAALASHGHLGFDALAAEQRIEVLGGALDAYDRATIDADLLIEVGGDAVEIAWLKRYRQATVWLHDEAEQALRVAMGEALLHQPVAHDSAYTPPAVAPEVVRTTAGQTILGERNTVNGVEVILQRGQDGRVLGTYQAQGDSWVLQEAEAELPGPGLAGTDLAKARARGAILLEHRQWVIAEARRQAQALAGEGVAGVIDGHLGLLREAAMELHDDVHGSDLLGQLAAAEAELGGLRDSLLVEVATQTQFPTLALLRNLHGQGLLRVTYEGRRHVLRDGSALDKYPIFLRSGPADAVGKPLWEAHLHYQDQAAMATAFDSGHLKAWKQRNLGYRDQLQARREGGALSIYRASFKLRDVQGILPLS